MSSQQPTIINNPNIVVVGRERFEEICASHEAHQSALRKLDRLREIEPRLRIIVETVAPELARELAALLAEEGKVGE